VAERSKAHIHVIFLARREGPSTADVVIYTNKGAFSYPVTGFGVPNKYNILPLLNIRVSFV
jgi:hypothetical protein